MNQPIDLDNPSFSALEFHEPIVTDYALGEVNHDECELVETLIEKSEEVARDLSGIQDMMVLLGESLEEEWRSRAPVDLDVPAFTDYALGELSGGEEAEFETMLKYSPLAKKELRENREFVILLSEGLEKEWKSELSSNNYRFSLVEATGEENVVSVNFARPSSGAPRSKKNLGPALMSLAAVLAGILVVCQMLSHSQPIPPPVATAKIVGFSSDHHVWYDVNEKTAEVSEAPEETTFNEYQRIQAELASIIADLDDPTVDLKSVHLRLNLLLNEHEELGLQILAE